MYARHKERPKRCWKRNGFFLAILTTQKNRKYFQSSLFILLHPPTLQPICNINFKICLEELKFFLHLPWEMKQKWERSLSEKIGIIRIYIIDIKQIISNWRNLESSWCDDTNWNTVDIDKKRDILKKIMFQFRLNLQI